MQNTAIPLGEKFAPKEEEKKEERKRRNYNYCSSTKSKLTFQQAFYALAYVTNTNTNNPRDAFSLVKAARAIADKMTHAELEKEFANMSLYDVLLKLNLSVDAEASHE